MPKIEAINGIYKIAKCDIIEPAIAKMRYGLIQGGITISELSSDRAFNAFIISITTKTERDSVEAFTLPLVKYSHGFLVKSKLSKLLGVKLPFGHAGHSLQFDN